MFLESFSSTRPAISCWDKSTKREEAAIASKKKKKVTLKNTLAVKGYHHATFNLALFTCNGGRRSTFAIDFAMMLSQIFLTGNSFYC